MCVKSASGRTQSYREIPGQGESPSSVRSWRTPEPAVLSGLCEAQIFPEASQLRSARSTDQGVCWFTVGFFFFFFFWMRFGGIAPLNGQSQKDSAYKIFRFFSVTSSWHTLFSTNGLINTVGFLLQRFSFHCWSQTAVDFSFFFFGGTEAFQSCEVETLDTWNYLQVSFGFWFCVWFNMDFVFSLVGFLMAVCHVSLRVRGQNGEFFWLLLDFDALVIWVSQNSLIDTKRCSKSRERVFTISTTFKYHLLLVIVIAFILQIHFQVSKSYVSNYFNTQTLPW